MQYETKEILAFIGLCDSGEIFLKCCVKILLLSWYGFLLETMNKGLVGIYLDKIRQKFGFDQNICC